MKSHKKANFRVALSILCAVTMLTTLFSGVSLNSVAAEPSEDYEFIDTFDTELDTGKWTKGSSIVEAKKDIGYIPKKEFANNPEADVLNVTATAGSYDNLTKNALVRTENSPAGDQLLEVVFSGDYDDAAGGANMISGWCTGVVSRAKTDENGNLIGGYIVLAKLSRGTDWWNGPEWIGCFKVNSDGSTNMMQLDNLSGESLHNKICKIQVAITDDGAGAVSLNYGLYTIGGANQSWNNLAKFGCTDTNAPIRSGKSGITMMSQSPNAPIVDFYNFSDKVKQVEPSDANAVFNSTESFNENDWHFGSGIASEKTVNKGFADNNNGGTDNALAISGTAGFDNTTANTMMRNVDSAAGNRKLSMVFCPNYWNSDFSAVAKDDSTFNNLGAGIVTHATVNKEGKLTGGYLVAVKTAGIWYESAHWMRLYKINSDGTLNELHSVGISALGCVWTQKLKLDLTVTDESDGSVTLNYSISRYDFTNKTWVNTISDSYKDTTPVINPIFAGKSGMVLYGDGTNNPKIQIYEFADNAVYPSTDLTDDFDSLSKNNWQFGSGIVGKEITAGYADGKDKAIKLTGTAGSTYNSKNTMLRKVTSPDGNRFIETEFDGLIIPGIDDSEQIKGWGVGVIANATDDGLGNLTGGYVLMAKMCGNNVWYNNPEWMQLRKINSDGTSVDIGDPINISELGCANLRKFKLQLSVDVGENSTALKYALLEKNTEGNWVVKYRGSYTDNTATVSGKSGVALMSDSGNKPIVDIYSFKDVTPKIPKIRTENLANVTMNEEYNAKIELSEEIPNSVKFTITNGKLPTGLFLDELTGNIVGIPLIDGEFNITVKVEDTLGNQDEKAYAFTVAPTGDLIFIEIRKQIIGVSESEINSFRIVDQNGDGIINICDLVTLDEKINK